MTDCPEITPYGKRRERLIMREINRQEAEFHAVVKSHMDDGLSFDDAWIAAGGMILPLINLAEAEESK